MASVMFLGVGISSRLKKRSVFLAEAVMFISRVSMEIEYVNLPLFEILKKINESGCCRSLDFIPSCISLWEKGEDFSFAWQNSLKNSALPMKKEEKAKLFDMGDMLGMSDAEGQRAMLSLYAEYFSAYSTRAAEEYGKYGKMCITLSAVTGTGLFILLM